jgi:hypothetical protein
MEVLTFIIAISGLIIATGALVKALDNRKDVELLEKQKEYNRLAIKNLNENFSKRVYEVLEEIGAKDKE